MTKLEHKLYSVIFHPSVIRLFVILGGIYVAYRLGQAAPWIDAKAAVPVLFLPLAVIGLRNPVLLVHAFPIVFYAASSNWRFMGLSALEVVGFSMVGLAALRVALRRDPFPRSNLYFPIFLYGLFLAAFLFMFPRHTYTQRLLGSILRGLALYLGAVVLIRNRKDVTRFVAALAIASLIPLAKLLFAAQALSRFSATYWGRGLELAGNYTTWQLNQIAPVLLLSALAFPDNRIRRLSAVGFLAVVSTDVISLSRGGIVDLAVVLLLAVPFLFSRRSSRLGRVLVGLPLVIIWVYSTFAGYEYISNMWNSLILDFDLGASRVDYFLANWETFSRYPLTGGLIPLGFSAGPGHSYWGSIARDYGVLFLLINFALMAFIVYDAYLLSRRSNDPILSTTGKGMLIGALLAPWQMFHDNVLYTQTYAMIFWLLRGMTTACLNMPGQPESEE